MSAEFLFTHRQVLFYGAYYVQHCEASMGARFSPSMANLYMGWCEECFLFSMDNPFTSQIICYGRYIEDLLMVWGGDTSDLHHFVEYLNDNKLNLHFFLLNITT